MSRTKSIATLLLVVTLLFAQVGSVLAAPSSQETTPITGTIESVVTETDENGVTTVLVTVTDDQEATQTYRLSLEAAIDLGLIQTDPVTGEPVQDPETGAPLVVDGLAGQPIEIDPALVIPDEGEEEEEAVHPIAAILAAFFDEDPGVVNDYHQDGFGFGVIAQAMWMSLNLNEDASLADLILDAKRSGDYSELESFLPEGTTLPSNWGQFKKAVQEKKNNLGFIVSGHAEDSASELTTQQQNGNGNGHGNGNGQGNGNGNGNGHGNGNGNGNGNGGDR